MYLKKTLFLFSFIICSLFPLNAKEIYLNSVLTKAQKGDFVVILQNKSFSLLHILQSEKNSLVIEEISAPIKLKSKIQGDWKKWIQQQAPGHTSWILYELNLKNCYIDQVYSCSQKSWKKNFPQEQIFATLMNLKFTSIPAQRRKKVGPPVPGGMLDDRPFWHPPIFFEGKKVKEIESEAFFSYWPQDGSDLSGKRIEIFLISEQDLVPNYFPIWLQVSDKVGQAKFRLIDSGRELVSSHQSLPIPPLEIQAYHFTRSGDLQFLIRSHPSFEHFTVYAKELGTPNCFSVPFEAHYNPDLKELSIVIQNEILNQKLKLDKFYTLIFEPEEYPHLSIETPKPLKLLKSYAHQ